MAKKQLQKKQGSGSLAGQRFLINNSKLRLILFLTCIVCYGNTVFNGYALDDDFAVTENPYVQKGLAGIPDILTHNYLQTKGKTADYRPLVSISFAIEHQFFGNSPRVSHFFNVALFFGCILVIFNLLTEVFSLQKLHLLLPFLITAFYAVHPVHTEVVASIKNRDEMLCLLFALLAMQFTFRFFNSSANLVRNGLLTALFLLLALASKVTAVLMVPVILLMCVFHNFNKRNAVFYVFGFLLVLLPLIYFLAVMHNIKRPNYFYENPLSNVADFSLQAGTAFETLLYYLRLLFVPYPLSFYYGYNTLPVISLANITAAFSFMLHSVLFVSGFLLFKRKNIAGFFILSYGLGIIFYCNYPFPYPGIVSERALFTSSLWFISFIALGIFNLGKFGSPGEKGFISQKTLVVLLFVAFAAYSWGTIQRNFQWKNALTLMSSDVGHLSNSVLANYFYAGNLQQAGETSFDSSRQYYLQLSKKYYRQSINADTGYSEAYFKLGMIEEYDEHQYDSACLYFARAYPKDTGLPPLEFQLAKSYFLKRDYRAANKLFNDLVVKLPTDTFTFFFYAQSLYFSGDTLKAQDINNRLLHFASNSNYPYLNRGMFSKFSGNMQQAAPDLLTAIKLGCREQQIVNLLLNYYLETGQEEKSQLLQQLVRR